MYALCGCVLLLSVQSLQSLSFTPLPPTPCFSTAFNIHPYILCLPILWYAILLYILWYAILLMVYKVHFLPSSILQSILPLSNLGPQSDHTIRLFLASRQ
jgi:hypothetical protein